MREISDLITLYIGDCLEVMDQILLSDIRYDAIVMDPPYEIGLWGMEWDQTGVAFNQVLWKKLFEILKPGAFLISFSRDRFYHRVAVAAEMSGFRIYPPLYWKFAGGMPKPMNVSNLFNREAKSDRQQIGSKHGSGYVKLMVDHGVQNVTHYDFPIYADATPEATAFKDHYYGVNAFLPEIEPILLAQKPIDQKRVIDNIRTHGTGSLYFGWSSCWPGTIFECPKAKKSEHESVLPCVKPLALMTLLCQIVGGGRKQPRLLDPFAGSGTTAVACQQSGYYCDLIEINPDMEPVIKNRIKRLST